MDSNATFSNCSFSNNLGMGLGDGFGYAGAIYSYNSIFYLTSCSFDANKADLDGGAIFAEYSEINATLSVFSNNQNAHNNGGGAWALKFCTLQESNGTYSNQYTASGGGAIDAADSNLTVTNTVFSSNQADYFGGAIKMVDCNGTIKVLPSMGIPLIQTEEPFISTQPLSCWKTMLSLITSQPTRRWGLCQGCQLYSGRKHL